jgi:hypothetical protein
VVQKMWSEAVNCLCQPSAGSPDDCPLCAEHLDSLRRSAQLPNWKAPLVSRLLEGAEWKPYSDGERAPCPACKSNGGMPAWHPGFKRPTGLRRHLEGWGGNRCRVMDWLEGVSCDRVKAKVKEAVREDIQKNHVPWGPVGARGYVYVVRCSETNARKIGIARDPVMRLRGMQTGAPYPLELVGAIEVESPVMVEMVLHERFGALRIHGEWFRHASEMDHVAELVGWAKDQLATKERSQTLNPSVDT